MNLFACENMKTIKKINLLNEGRISYDSGDFRKKFDSFIKNINEQTKINLSKDLRRKSSFDLDSVSINHRKRDSSPPSFK